MARKTTPKMPRWLMGQDPASKRDNLHYVSHLQTPRFIARWCFGPPKPMPKQADRMFVENGEGDLVHVYDFVWIDAEPEAADYTSLMSDLVDAVDQWLENNIAPPTR